MHEKSWIIIHTLTPLIPVFVRTLHGMSEFSENYFSVIVSTSDLHAEKRDCGEK
jgi:hypothetical protein